MKKEVNWAELVKKAQAQDQEAITELYNETYAKAYAVAMQTIKNEQDALDVLQDAYISAFKNLHALKDPAKFRGWMSCIVANRCRDYLRKRKDIVFSDMEVNAENVEFDETLESTYAPFSPEETVDYTETKRLMQEILDTLSEEQRLCVLMFYYEELSVKEIAEAFACSENTIKSRLNYGRQKIKDEVKALEKKGTKLYTVTPLPFIVWMLRDYEVLAQTPKAAIFLQELLKTPMQELNVQTFAKGTDTPIDTKITDNVSIISENKSQKILSQTEQTIVKSATSMSLKTKLLAGVICIGIIGGTIFGTFYNQKSDNSKTQTTEDATIESYTFEERPIEISAEMEQALSWYISSLAHGIGVDVEVNPGDVVTLDGNDFTGANYWLVECNMLKKELTWYDLYSNREMSEDELGNPNLDTLPVQAIYLSVEEYSNFYTSTVGRELDKQYLSELEATANADGKIPITSGWDMWWVFELENISGIQVSEDEITITCIGTRFMDFRTEAEFVIHGRISEESLLDGYVLDDVEMTITRV